MRLTRRGQRLLALVGSAAFIASLLAGFLIGEQQRCHRLTASHDISASYYCPQGATK